MHSLRPLQSNLPRLWLGTTKSYRPPLSTSSRFHSSSYSPFTYYIPLRNLFSSFPSHKRQTSSSSTPIDSVVVFFPPLLSTPTVSSFKRFLRSPSQYFSFDCNQQCHLVSSLFNNGEYLHKFFPDQSIFQSFSRSGFSRFVFPPRHL